MINPSNHEYFAAILEEKRIKQLAIDEQVQLELLGLNEPIVDKDNRQEYMKYLANRILQINVLLEPWLNAVKLDIDRLAR